MLCASAVKHRRILRCCSTVRSATSSSVSERLRSIGSGLLNELNEFVKFGLYTWMPKRAELKLNSALNAISTAASKAVGGPGLLPFELRQNEYPPWRWLPEPFLVRDQASWQRLEFSALERSTIVLSCPGGADGKRGRTQYA